MFELQVGCIIGLINAISFPLFYRGRRENDYRILVGVDVDVSEVFHGLFTPTLYHGFSP